MAKKKPRIELGAQVVAVNIHIKTPGDTCDQSARDVILEALSCIKWTIAHENGQYFKWDFEDDPPECGNFAASVDIDIGYDKKIVPSEG
jgi:hypothetical protein